MTFLTPLFAWGFLSLAAILALYLLKRRYEARPVPSTFLWRRASRDLTASRPLQRLRRNILLPIQLLMAAVLTLALMRPALPGAVGGETVMIFDLSASMQAWDGDATRLEHAVSAAEGMIDGLGPADALTILAVDGETRQLLSRSTDRDAARRALNGLTAYGGDCDLSGALSLADAMERELGDMNLVVFSDDFTAPEGVAVCSAPKGLDNLAVASFTVEDGTGYARVVNYGPEAEITLACYAEGELCDARTLRIPEGESAGTSLNVPDCRWARVEIQEKDAIAADNALHWVAKLQRTYTVALSGDGSVFLERAIGLRDDLQLLRTSDEERALTDADLYVYGASPLVFSLDPEQTAIRAGEETEAEGRLSLAERDELTAGLTLTDVAVRAYRPLEGGRALMTLDGRCVMAAGRRAVALGFDVHDTNLPMKYDFPILVQNILNALLPQSAADVGDGLCGEEIAIPLPADCEGAVVTRPGGERTTLALAQDVRFDETGEPGLYTLALEGGDDAGERYFALRMPLSESDVRSVAPSADGDGGAAVPAGGAELTELAIALFLALLLIEWVVRRRVA